ncbi:AraC family transcriptional regulator [Ramlibacter tataouinensis]|uniref:helix-turn-helix domain-containing protein n=1 Tax=Ramlibacter tataouinensis TaxID=94132 RepID=UPI0022F3E904|nr:AraC family transcriptional regulator [Ramlibacter tataouinensis]WBY02334.1 AraC family transcriptional regulator [Ramlibacter tataouinensis]
MRSDPFPVPFPRRLASGERLMWITPERVFYAGLLGEPSMHTRGSLTVHVAAEAPLKLRLQGGEWQTAEVAVVQPGRPYQVACEGRHAIGLLLEPETVDPARLPELLRANGAVRAPAFAAHVRQCHARMVAAGAGLDLRPADFDPLFFGAPLAARPLDPRIAAVLERLRADPSAALSAHDGARQAGLSFSRFLHLFREQAGVPFRSLRSWKRARSLLHHVSAAPPLVDLALDIGYPDSSHFSHSIRQSYGLKPRDIVAGSRKLRVIAQAAMA